VPKRWVLSWVRTPGQNRKAYLAGAMAAKTDRLIWVKGKRKNRDLFIALLAKLLKPYPDRKRVHVIHSSRQTRRGLTEHGQRICLHFLPPYCPDDNRIERCLWRELHANVTRNHNCVDLEELLGESEHYLRKRDRAAKRRARSESRKAIWQLPQRQPMRRAFGSWALGTDSKEGA
jgi:transposase